MKKMKAAMVVSSLLILGLVLSRRGRKASDTAQGEVLFSVSAGWDVSTIWPTIAMEALKVPD